MQPVRLPGRGRVVGMLLVALGSGVTFAMGTSLSRSGMQAASLIVGTLALFLALGLHISGRALARAVAAMRAGEHLGAWGGAGRPRVDVGAWVWVVDGEPVLYALHFERALAVELDDDAGELRFRVLANDGNGSVEVVRAAPFGPEDRAAALAAGGELAAMHGVEPPG